MVQLMLQIVMNPYLDAVHAHLRTRFGRLLRTLDAAGYSIYQVSAKRATHVDARARLRATSKGWRGAQLQRGDG